MANDYEKRLMRVLDYVYDNLDGDLSLDRLAEVAALSRFHFHRVFTGITGEPLAGFVRRVRLHKAANLLLLDDTSLEKVAAQCGYENARSFTRLFRDAFGRTPLEFRSMARPVPPLLLSQTERKTMYPIELTNEPRRRLAVMPLKGNYFGVGEVFEKVSATLGARGLLEGAGPMVGLYYSDPQNVPEEELESEAGFILPDTMPIEAPLQERILEGGKHAILTFKGPYAGLSAAYGYLYGAWLAQSGETPRDAPPFELYVNSPAESAPEELITLIGMALK
ncbi:MAG: AraC family transcriptional regulator [Maritimibacter sp.]